MAFPVDAGRAGYNSSASINDHPVTLPASISAGDLLVMVARKTAFEPSGIDLPSGWSWLVQNDSSDASDDITSIIYKKADGSEGATQSVILSGGGTTRLAATTWRITGAADPANQAPEASTIAVGASTTPDPTTVTPSGGAKDYLFLWVGGWEGEQTSPPASVPTSYANAVGGSTGITGSVATNARTAGASRQLNAASENPGSWTISASDQWSAWTVAIHPVGALVDANAEISWTEVEVPFTNADSEVAFAEIEVPTADSRADIAWTEFEVPFLDASAEIAWTEVEVPFLSAAAEVSWAELENPFAPANAEISWTEFEVPTVDGNSEISWAEVEVPFLSAAAEMSWAELETPFAPANAEISWMELEVPFADAEAAIAWAEVQISDPDANAEISWAEFEVLNANADAEVSWSEFEVPTADAASEVVWAEVQFDIAPANAEVAWAEFETPDVDAPPIVITIGRRGRRDRWKEPW